MIVNDDCSSWYITVGDFLMLVWVRRKEILYGEGSARKVSQNDFIRKCEANSNKLLWRLNVSDLFY